MPSLELLAPFFVATAVFAYFPGPALLYTAAQTLGRGRRAGLMAALGIHLGCYVHVVAAALGLSAVFVHVPLAYLALKIVGAAYLIWLGVQMMRRPITSALPVLSAKSARRALGESMLVEILNPKVAVFFIAFLPQFVDPAAAWPLWLQFLAMGTFVNLMFTSADLVTVALTERVVGAVRASGAGARVARALGGSALVGLGAHLALSRN